MNLKLIWCGLMAISFSMAHAQNFPKIEASYGSGTQEFSLATGSPGELGLLKLLGEEFGKKENAKMNWVKAGSGASLNLLKNKQVDMIMVHAPSAVNKAISEGWAVNRTLIGSNFSPPLPEPDPSPSPSASPSPSPSPSDSPSPSPSPSPSDSVSPSPHLS